MTRLNDVTTPPAGAFLSYKIWLKIPLSLCPAMNKKNDSVHYKHAGSGMLQIGYNVRKALVKSSAPWYIYPVIDL
jgi:hypothetical protein